MEINAHKVVTIDYTLRDDAGVLIESSEGSEPFSYIHGTGSIIRGLEAALEGKSPGDEVTVSVSPEDTYGRRDESLIQVLPRTRFQTHQRPEVGMRFQATTAGGDARVVTIVKVEGDSVTVDANHPLAGVTLVFAIVVRRVREATREELAHGHVHDPDNPH